MKTTLYLLTTLLLATMAAPALAGAASGKSTKYRVYIGTYTRGESKGIYHCILDLKDGSLSNLRLAAEADNPSFLAIHPDRKYLYAVNEVNDFQGKKSGAVSAFAIDPETGNLTFLNQQPSRGGAPCHLVVDAAGKNVLVANYTGGSVACLPIRKNGKLKKSSSFIQHAGSSVNKRRQEGPHGHSINLDHANRFAFAADLGLDKVLVYRFDAEAGTLTPHDPPAVSLPPGSGPRHFAFHPTEGGGGRFAYVINELLSTVTAFRYHADKGELETLQTISTLPEDFTGGNSTAEVRVHPSGKFVYGSNRGHDSLAIFRVDPDWVGSGHLTYIENQKLLGRTPRNFFIEPTGQYLLAESQADGFIENFRINQDTGRLQSLGKSLEVPSPVCIRMIPLEE